MTVNRTDGKRDHNIHKLTRTPINNRMAFISLKDRLTVNMEGQKDSMFTGWEGIYYVFVVDIEHSNAMPAIMLKLYFPDKCRFQDKHRYIFYN